MADDRRRTRRSRKASPDEPHAGRRGRASLDVLSDDAEGFFVMFEQGDIDWSNHANDFENMIGGVWDLDQAVRAAEDQVASGVRRHGSGRTP